MNFSFSRVALLITTGAVTTVLLSGCMASTPSETSSMPSDSSAIVAQAGPITVADTWFKAVPEGSAEMGMTGIFGTFTNDSDSDINIVGGSVASQYSDSPLEAHTVVADSEGTMKMQPAAGGIPVPAHGTVVLKPGSYHLMALNLKQALPAGTILTVSVHLSNGTTLDMQATARDVTSGDEHYNSKS